MDSKLIALRPYRQPLAASAATLVITAAAGIGLWRLSRGGGTTVAALETAAVPVALLAGSLLIAAAATVALRWSRARPPSDLGVEEPLIARPRMPAIRRDHPLIALVGLTPRCGASTLAANVTILVATQGRLGTDPACRPRTLCLLNRSDGPGGLTLDGNGLREYLANHPAAAREDLVELAVPHPSGAEFLSCADVKLSGFQLRQILPVLRRYYDLIVFDVPVGDRWLCDVAIELADAVLLVALPSPDVDVAISRWSERIWGLASEGKTILVPNALTVGDRPLVRHPLEFLLELPEEPEVSESDGRGAPWALGTSNGARQFRTGCRLLLPGFFSEGNRR